MDAPSLRIERDGAVATLVLDRPGRLNAIGSDTVALLDAALDAIEKDPAVRALVVTGAGGRFSAGANLSEIAGFERPEQFRRLIAAMAGTFTRLERLDRPVIAAVEGIALGGGLELALSCDLIVAGHGARLGLPEVRLGLVPGAGGTQRLARRLPPAVAKSLLLTGDSLDAPDAARLGLITQVVADGKALSTALELAHRLALGAPLAMAAAKRLAEVAEQVPLEEGIALERETNTVLFGSLDRAEGIAAFQERRPARFTGA